MRLLGTVATAEADFCRPTELPDLHRCPRTATEWSLVHLSNILSKAESPSRPPQDWSIPSDY